MTEGSDWISKKIDKFVVVNKKLGKGAFGTVFRGFFEEDENKLVAAKQIPIKNISNSDRMIKLIKREINNLQKLDSKYIVKLYDVSRTPNNLYMFLEYCMDGDLKEYLKKKKGGQLSEPEAIKFFKHIVEGFKELQKHQIIHRDIKPANIMLSGGRAKISDFGFSRQLEADNQQYLTLLGSPLYMSPQILEGTKFSSKCDVWSVGLVFYEMLYGKTPWMGTSQLNLFNNIKEKALAFPAEPVRSEKVKNLIKRMLQFREEDRISWHEVFEDEMIVGDRKMLEESVRLIENNNDNLEKSMLENGAYIQTNLVVNYLKNVEEDNETESDEKVNQQNPSTQPHVTESDEKMVHQQQNQPDGEGNISKQTITEDKYQYEEKAEQLVKAQIDQEKMRKNIMKVNEYILYERNVSFFYNFVIQKIIKSFNSNALQISGDLYFRIIFAICKCQNINLERVNSMLKSTTSEFNQQLWKNYQSSREFLKTQKTITLDIFHSKKFFQELIKKTSEVVDNSSKKDPSKDNLKKFQEIMNDKFTQDSNFKQVYQHTLAELLSSLKPLVTSTNKKDLLIIVRYIIVCQNPYSEFNNSDFDFNKFYEEIDNCNLESIRQEVLKKMATQIQ